MALVLNGHEKSSASAEIDLYGVTYTGIKTLDWSHEVEKGVAEGNGQVGIGPTKGPYKASLDFEMLQTQADLFEADIGTPLSEAIFNVGVMWVEGGSVSELEISYVTIVKVEGSLARGPDGAYKKFTCHVWYPIKENGIALVALPDESTSITASITASFG
jgi:hypothetical protein